MNSVSTHVLDTGTGRPAPEVDVAIERLDGEEWLPHGRGSTDVNGRITGFGVGFPPGRYRIRFDTGGYGSDFYPEVQITVDLTGADEHYHIPLLLSPYGYTTYRGS